YSSSTTSCTLRPRMPPALFTRSAHHSVPRRPAVPTGAAIPARIATMPILTSGACARALSGKPPTLATAPLATTPFRNVRLLAIAQSPLDMGAAQLRTPKPPLDMGAAQHRTPKPPLDMGAAQHRTPKPPLPR